MTDRPEPSRANGTRGLAARAGGGAGGSRLRPAERGIAVVILCGLAYLGWAYWVPAEWGGGDGAESPAASHAPVAVPAPVEGTRADGMRTATFDNAAVAAFFSAVELPAVPGGLPVMEASIGAQLHRLMASLASRRGAEDYGRVGHVFSLLMLHKVSQACYERAAALSPGDYRWPHYLGRLATDRGRPAEAEACFRRAVGMNPNSASTRWLLARAVAQQGRAKEAEQILEDSLRLDAQAFYPWMELGRLAMDRGDGHAARWRLEEALKRNPESARIHALLGRVLAATGDQAGSRRHARLARKGVQGLDPVPDPLYSELLKTSDALAYYRRIVAPAQKSARAWHDLVRTYERITQLDPANADDRVELALAYYEVGRRLEAVQTMDAAVAQQPEAARLHAARAQLAMRMGDAAGALRHAEDALARDGSHVIALGLRALALAAQGRPSKGIASAERALELSPDEIDIYLVAASLHQAAGGLAQARAVLERALQVDPEAAGPREMLAQLAAAEPVGPPAHTGE